MNVKARCSSREHNLLQFLNKNNIAITSGSRFMELAALPAYVAASCSLVVLAVFIWSNCQLILAVFRSQVTSLSDGGNVYFAFPSIGRAELLHSATMVHHCIELRLGKSS